MKISFQLTCNIRSTPFNPLKNEIFSENCRDQPADVKNTRKKEKEKTLPTLNHTRVKWEF